jgi:hypothetical protein
VSTLKIHELAEQERQALCMLVQSQWQLIMVRGLQVVAHSEEAEMYANCERRVEAQSEEQAEHIERLQRELEQNRGLLRALEEQLGKKDLPF